MYELKFLSKISLAFIMLSIYSWLQSCFVWGFHAIDRKLFLIIFFTESKPDHRIEQNEQPTLLTSVMKFAFE